MNEISQISEDANKQENNGLYAPGSTKPRKTPQKRGFKTELLILAIILLAGLILRGLYLVEILDAPDFSSPAVDAGFHDYWARALISGDWTPPEPYSDPGISTKPFLRPPGYAYFLAFLYYLSDSSYLIARVYQMFLGVVNCVLAWIIGRYMFRRAVGLIFAAFMSLYWIFILFEGELHEPVILIFVLLSGIVALILWLKRFLFRYVLLAGFLFGLSSLIRPNCLLFLPVTIVWICWVAHKSVVWRSTLTSAMVLTL